MLGGRAEGSRAPGTSASVSPESSFGQEWGGQGGNGGRNSKRRRRTSQCRRRRKLKRSSVNRQQTQTLTAANGMQDYVSPVSGLLLLCSHIEDGCEDMNALCIYISVGIQVCVHCIYFSCVACTSRNCLSLL